jgi:hypothetical protein
LNCEPSDALWNLPVIYVSFTPALEITMKSLRAPIMIDL